METSDSEKEETLMVLIGGEEFDFFVGGKPVEDVAYYSPIDNLLVIYRHLPFTTERIPDPETLMEYEVERLVPQGKVTYRPKGKAEASSSYTADGYDWFLQKAEEKSKPAEASGAVSLPLPFSSGNRVGTIVLLGEEDRGTVRDILRVGEVGKRIVITGKSHEDVDVEISATVCSYRFTGWRITLRQKDSAGGEVIGLANTLRNSPGISKTHWKYVTVILYP
jgi:hypothetical protein